MTRSILWKEFREQAAIVVALLVTGCGLMAGMSVFLEPQDRTRSLDIRVVTGVAVLGATLMAIAAGGVIGSTLFAGEREAGTFALLDRLPGSRWRVWWRKVAAGLYLAAVPAAGYAVAAVLTGVIGGPAAGPQAALLFATATFFGFAWGTVGSATLRTSLGACAAGLALGVVVTGLLAAGVPVLKILARAALPAGWLRQELPAYLDFFGPIAVVFTALVVPLAISAFVYTIPDRERSLGGFVAVPTPSGRMRTLRLRLPRVGLPSVGLLQPWKRLAWLLARQHRVTAVWLAAAAVASGCLLLLPDAVFISVWPPLGLVFGVLVGVALFADEQSTESARFWGERRLRVGGLWAAKLAFGFSLLFGLTLLMFVPTVARGLVEAERSRNLFGSALGSAGFGPDFPYLGLVFLGPVYGFVFGQLAGLLFRKAVVAAAVGLMVGGMAAALWLPSLFAGGVHAWQLWTPPLLVLAVSRSLIWPWATRSLVETRGPLVRFAGGLTLVAATLAGGIAWRAAEVPEVAEADDDLLFSAELPTFDETQSGRDVRRAVSQFSTRLDPHLLTPALPPEWGLSPNPAAGLMIDSLDGHLHKSGYPWTRPDIDDFLKLLGTDWEQALLDGARKPVGVFIDPNELNPSSNLAVFQAFRRMIDVSLLRGVQAQRAGDPEDFVGRLEVVLATVRSTRGSGPRAAVAAANAAETSAHAALRHWLTALRGRPELLRRVLTALLDHERLDPHTERRTQLAEQVIVRNGVAAPAQWLPQFFRGNLAGLGRGVAPARAEAEADVVAFMWSVPWERERLRRAVGYNNRPGAEAGGPNYLDGVPGLWLARLIARSERPKEGLDITSRLAIHRLNVLQVAVRLFEADAGRFPATLDELVPKYLATLPLDPYDPAAGPLRYRVSPTDDWLPVNPPQSLGKPDPLSMSYLADADPGVKLCVGAAMGPMVFYGETEPLAPPGSPVKPVAPDGSPARQNAAIARQTLMLKALAGQPIVWSVGTDRQDTGGIIGVVVPPNQSLRGSGDIIVVVPLPAEAKSP